MKKVIFVFSIVFCFQVSAQNWTIVSQNNQNSMNFIPENVWMSPSGNRITISAYDNNQITFLNSTYQLDNNYLRVYVESDTNFNASLLVKANHFRDISDPSTNGGLFYLSDSVLFFQTQLDTGDVFLSHTSQAVEIIRVLINFQDQVILNLVNDVETIRFFRSTDQINLNKRLRNNLNFSDSVLIGSSNHLITRLLIYDHWLNEKYSIATSFHKADSTIVGAITGHHQYKNEFVFSGGTVANGGRVFDEYYDDADILAITDTLGNKKKVFHARDAKFPYLNYDGSNLYFTCDCYPNSSYIQNTPMTGFSLGKLDSAGRVKWSHRIPPQASVVQDSVFRTYIFGHQRNGEPLFGEQMANNELYMAVIDTDGAVVHFEHDSNFFWPNSYYYKLLYSPITGVNLFMSHLTPVSMGSLQVSIDSSSQNMFLARFALVEDTTGENAIKEAKVDGRLILYPNPSKDNLQIEYYQEIHEIRVIDMTGKQVYEQLFSPIRNKRIAISTLSPGHYILEAKSSKGWVKRSFVKE